jgi:hypothetical protein
MGWTYQARAKGIPTYDFFATLWNSEHTQVIGAAAPGFDTVYVALKTPQGVTAIVVETQWVKDFHNFGYKDCDEGCGPFNAACPERILKLLSPVEDLYEGESLESARRWRAECQAAIDARKAKPTVRPGDIVVFQTPVTFTTGTRQRLRFVKGSRFVDEHGYGRFRLAKWRQLPFTVERASTA